MWLRHIFYHTTYNKFIADNSQGGNGSWLAIQFDHYTFLAQNYRKLEPDFLDPILSLSNSNFKIIYHPYSHRTTRELLDMNPLTPGEWHTTGNPIYAECLGFCRVLEHGHSAKSQFAECLTLGARQIHGTRHTFSLPSAGSRQTLGTRHT